MPRTTRHPGYGSSAAFPRFESYRHINEPRPEERALARVSKDGHKRNRASGHPSRRRFAPPQDEVCGCKQPYQGCRASVAHTERAEGPVSL
jgi:hypothetical protein